jgi:hypothetical protein
LYQQPKSTDAEGSKTADGAPAESRPALPESVRLSIESELSRRLISLQAVWAELPRDKRATVLAAIDAVLPD